MVGIPNLVGTIIISLLFTRWYSYLSVKRKIYGVILVGTCPGGTSSNVITYLSKGDVAYSVGMTNINTLLAPVLTLLNKLFELDRIDDAKKVATDKDYRMILLKEFGIED